MSNTTPAAADRAIALIDGALADHQVSPDAMRWHPVRVPGPVPIQVEAEVPADVCVGDVVEYHGSILVEHGEFVVVGAPVDPVDPEDNRLILRNHHYPDTRLSNVRPTSVTATGRWVPVCQCEHPLTHPENGPTGACPRIACECPHHP